ncbi:MAG: hypothetical protein ABI833_21130 [Acidobacteriota bacterium]
MRFVENILRSVIEAATPSEFRAVQNKLADAIERQEGIIQRKKQRHLDLRKAIKQCSEPSVGSFQFHRDRREHLRRLLAANQASEAGHRFARSAILYLGDTLAYRLMPNHVVRLHGRNSSPGFFGGKKGREQEFGIADFLCSDGWTVLLHDLTHCLKIGDLTAVCQDRGVLSVECGTGVGSRKKRQSQRMKLLNRVLNEDVRTVPPDELVAHGFPTMLLEGEIEPQHNTDAFCEVADCDATGWKVVQPEDGLIYAACLPERGAKDFVREVARVGHGWRNYMVTCFRDRIMGDYSWVPPIMLLSIPVQHLVRLLERRFYFYVFIDVDYVRRRLAELSPSLLVSERGGHIRFETIKLDCHIVRGPRSVENVQYGLVSLGSALQMLAMEPHIDPAALAR